MIDAFAMLSALRSNETPGLHNLIVSSKRHGTSVPSASVSLQFNLAGISECNLQTHQGLFLDAFAFLFSGFDEVVHDSHYTKEF